ncbi:uncharacterized protein G2W53_035328 [Senna tora]|uniref:MBD domain-containing protein n=1 Tax=Senna tora TaxID=362788 RepID=A0A834SQ70_9FABA|nr:uncharacterized protein G2W53_035328 [Senna tora]
MDRFALNYKDPCKQPDPLQFSFIERLQNWNIQFRKRPEGRWDMFYRYGANPKRLFRSKSEVTDFIAYEICPAESPGKKTKKADNTEKDANEVIDHEGMSCKSEEDNQQKDDNKEKAADEVTDDEGISCKSEEDNQQKDLGKDDKELIDVHSERIVHNGEDQREMQSVAQAHDIV